MSARSEAFINPALLVWARRAAGLTIRQAAEKLHVPAERLVAWELGGIRPSIPQLRQLSSAYRRPFAAFFLPAPPADEMPAHPHDFRRLPSDEAGQISPEILLELRRARLQRETALGLFQSTGEAQQSLAIAATTADDPADVARRLRNELGVTMHQQAGWRDRHRALREWIERVERLGVLVFQTSRVPLDEMRGFSIAEAVLPVIVLNGQDHPNGRIFSLIHEMAHLALRLGGICQWDRVAADVVDQEIERFCNRVAGESLVPSSALAEALDVAHAAPSGHEWEDDQLVGLADHFGVSREVILRRLLTLGRTTEDFYRQKRALYLAEYASARRRRKERAGKGGPSQARMVIRDRGPRFTHLVLRAFYEDAITDSEVAEHLGVRLRHIPDVEAELERRERGEAA